MLIEKIKKEGKWKKNRRRIEWRIKIVGKNIIVIEEKIERKEFCLVCDDNLRYINRMVY